MIEKNVIFRHFSAQVLEKNKLKNVVSDTKYVTLRLIIFFVMKSIYYFLLIEVF